jgi:tetratricopeptide (TPR) repeat protein
LAIGVGLASCSRQQDATTPETPLPDANAYYSRGVAHYNKGDNDRAIADFSQAIKLNPKNVQAYVARGDVYSKKGDDDRAIADFTQAIQLDPKNANAADEQTLKDIDNQLPKGYGQ